MRPTVYASVDPCPKNINIGRLPPPSRRDINRIGTSHSKQFLLSFQIHYKQQSSHIRSIFHTHPFIVHLTISSQFLTTANTTTSSTMPSQVSNWFARHCAPPPPLNSVPVCTCSSCFNTAAQGRQTTPYNKTYASSSDTLVPTSQYKPSKQDSDSVSLSSCETVTTTAHVEQISQ